MEINGEGGKGSLDNDLNKIPANTVPSCVNKCAENVIESESRFRLDHDHSEKIVDTLRLGVPENQKVFKSLSTLNLPFHIMKQ